MTRRINVARAPKAGQNDLDVDALRSERAVRWADGFVSADGIHIPLFVPQASLDRSFRLKLSVGAGRGDFKTR